ncbi:UNVERIFIED_CONTAM: CHRD domain-containing protein [Bacteroidetes bacterium 56_B9]
MKTSKSAFLAFTMTASMMLAGPAFAERVALKAQLNGASAVPPTTSTGTGTADITLDTASKTLSWKLTYSGLSGPVTMAHFHGPAEPGKNAGVAVALPKVDSGSEGSATLTDAQAADLLAGKYYVNVHTNANPGGEIRGQVTK